jgi:hypothetical protein
MQRTYSKFLAIPLVATALTGCQLLLDNRDKGNAAVVVVPAADWDAMRAAGLREQAAAEISAGLAVAIADEVEARATKAIIAAEAAKAAATANPAPVPQKGIQPIKGSESIPFSNRTNSQLGGCSILGVIELHHTGTLEDALIVLRNETYRMNSNLLVPIKASRTPSKGAVNNEIRIEARMMRCPIKLVRGN